MTQRYCLILRRLGQKRIVRLSLFHVKWKYSKYKYLYIGLKFST